MMYKWKNKEKQDWKKLEKSRCIVSTFDLFGEGVAGKTKSR